MWLNVNRCVSNSILFIYKTVETKVVMQVCDSERVKKKKLTRLQFSFLHFSTFCSDWEPELVADSQGARRRISE